MLSRHWRAWQLHGADVWTVAVLQDGYCIPFHHLPSTSLVPQELSCAPGFGSGIIPPVGGHHVAQSGPGYYSRLFLVEKVTGSWRPVIDLSAMDSSI